MWNFIVSNLATIIIVAVLAVAVFFIVRGMIKKRQKGGCACGCDGCSSSEYCSGSHQHKQ